MKSIRGNLAVTLLVTCVTAWFSYAYFNIDEYFQVVEPARFKLGQDEAWTLPWELREGMRPWLQPFVYFVVGRVLGAVSIDDPFALGFAFRLVTGLACVAALASFVRTTTPWFQTEDGQRLHVRVATLAGFLPYLFVRTSSETFSMAAATAAFGVLLEGAERTSERRRWIVPSLERPVRLAAGGLLLGFAFEARFQTAFLAAGIAFWLRLVGRARAAAFAWLSLGGLAALGIGALVDRWGYGAWTFPAWRYFRTNVLEGAAAYFGTDPPLAYFWALPANVFLPVVVVLLVLAVVAWLRFPWHPVTWATLPFFAVHNLIPHKEERFVFPIAVLATALVTMALESSPRLFRLRNGWLAKGLAVGNFAAMALLAFYPLGWHHHVRFQRYVHRHVGDELRAHALPAFELGLPAYHPRVYDVEKSDAESIVRRIDEGTARPWLIADTPVLRDEAPALAERTTLVWSELPFDDPETVARIMRVVDAYNVRARAPLRPILYRSLYRINAPAPRPKSAAE